MQCREEVEPTTYMFALVVCLELFVLCEFVKVREEVASMEYPHGQEVHTFLFRCSL